VAREGEGAVRGGAAWKGVAAGVAGSAAVIAAATAASRVVGFGRVFVFSGAVGGGGCLGTAYTTVNYLPNVLFEVAAGGALAGAVVPVIAGMLARGRKEDAGRTASALLGWVLLALAPLSLLLALAARPLAAVLLHGSTVHGSTGAAGSCPGEVAAGARMLVVFAPQVLLYGVGIVLAGVLQAHRRFVGPALAPMLSSLVVIIAYVTYGELAGGRQQRVDWLPPPGPELVLSGGTTLGVVALSLPLLVPLRRTGIRLRPALRFPAGAVGQLRSLALAGLSSLLAQQVAILVTLALANRIGGTGAPNVVQFAQTVYLLPYAVLAVPLATAAFPRLSAQAAAGDPGGFAATAATTTRLVLLVSCLGAGALFAVAPAVQGLFLDLDAVGGGPLTSLADTLVAMAPGLIGWSLVAHLGRVLYARGHGRAAALATAAGWLAVVVASVAVVFGLRAGGQDAGRSAVVGLGAGNSVGMLVAAVLLLAGVRAAAGRGAVAGLARVLPGGLAAAAAGAVAGRWAADLVLGGLGVAGGLGGQQGVAGQSGGQLDMTGTAGRAGSGSLADWVLAGGVGGMVAVLAFVGVVLLVDRRDVVALLARVRRADAAQPGSGGVPAGSQGAVAAGEPAVDARHCPAVAGAQGSQGAVAAGEPAGSVQGPTCGGLRVLLVLATSAGGVGRHVRALATGLDEAGCTVTVAGHPATERSFGFTACGVAFAPVEVGDRPRPGADLRAVRRLRALSAEADVVHAHGLRAAALAVLAARGRHLPPGGRLRGGRVALGGRLRGGRLRGGRLRGGRRGRGLVTPGGQVRGGRAPGRRRLFGSAGGRPLVVVTLHNAPASTGLAGLVSAALERLVARGAGAVLVVSGDVADRMRRLGARRVERALVPAPHREPSGPAAEVRTRTRAALGVGEEAVLLLTVARLASQKGLPVLIDAVATLATARPDGAVVAVVAGDGPLAGELTADLAARDVPVPLRLLGARDDVADLLVAADVLVMSSRWEGQPLAVQEALRAGLPVVATDAGGTAEVTGDAALLVPPGDSAALAAALAQVVDDAGLRRDLAERAAARARTLPTEADAVRQVLGVYANPGAGQPGAANPGAGRSDVVPRAGVRRPGTRP
jgi:putative peptidoglycan lipid II flippase